MDTNVKVPIILSVAQVNQIIETLAEQPFKVVAPLISEIHNQAVEAVAHLNKASHEGPDGLDEPVAAIPD